MSKLTFSFKKKEEKPIVKPTTSQFVSKDDEDKKEDREYITSIVDNKIESKNKIIEEKKVLIIPCIDSRKSILGKLSKLKKESIKPENELNNELNDQIKIKEEQIDLNDQIKIKEERIDLNEDVNKVEDLNRLNNQINVKKESINLKNGDNLKQEKNYLSLDELARMELIKSATGQEDDSSKTNSNLKIEIKKENKIDNNVKDDVEDPNYDQMPISEYTDAMFRGMQTNYDEVKKESKSFELKNVFTGGVGLGYVTKLKKDTLSKLKKTNKRYLPGEDDNELIKDKIDPDELIDDEIKINSLICIEHGKHKDYYGKVVSINDDITHCEIQLAISKSIVSLPISLVRLVSKKEYSKESLVINRSQLDNYQNKIEGNNEKDDDRTKYKNDKRSDDKRDDNKRYDNGERDKYDRKYNDKRTKYIDKKDKYDYKFKERDERSNDDKRRNDDRRDKYDNNYKRRNDDKRDKYDSYKRRDR